VNIAVGVNLTATLTLLNGLAPGTGASERIGMKVSIRSIEMRYNLEVTPATGLEQTNRVLLVLDRQCNGAAPGALTDIITAASCQAPRNLANRKRFKIIMDKSYAMGATAVATGNPTSRWIKKYIKLGRPIVEEFNTGVAGTVADISSNSLYFVTIGSIVAGDADSVLNATIRLRYTDM